MNLKDKLENMKIELRWVIVIITLMFGAIISTMGVYLMEPPFGSEIFWFLAYIPYIVSILYTIGVEKTKMKNEK